jgi:NADPH-dependent 2,4-dienoyl-CoA reductase/sulfur reductase-like enzyme
VTRIVVVGAGQAGGHAAVAARRAGFAGEIVLVGAEAVAPYERPPLSKEHLLAEGELPPPWLMKAERYVEAAVDLRLGTTVEVIDLAAREVRTDVGAIAFDTLLLATGGRARTLAMPGGEHVRYLRTWDDAIRIRRDLAAARRVICIGAGVIGLELAASARKLGREVTVIEAGASVMGRCLAPEEARFVERMHRESGVSIRFGTTVRAIGGTQVLLDSGETLPADLVLAGVGMERNTALAAAAGLALEGGIVVDAFGETATPGVYAAGDVAAFWHPGYGRRMRLESWHHAQDHGVAVGRAMAGQRQPYDATPRFWTTQYGVDIQVLGLPAEAVETVVRGDVAARKFTALHLDGAGQVVAATIVNNAREIRPALALIRAARRPSREDLASAPLQQLAAA